MNFRQRETDAFLILKIVFETEVLFENSQTTSTKPNSKPRPNLSAMKNYAKNMLGYEYEYEHR